MAAGSTPYLCFAPDGSVDRIIELPVSQPTSCCFAGPDLATLAVDPAATPPTGTLRVLRRQTKRTGIIGVTQG